MTFIKNIIIFVDKYFIFILLILLTLGMFNFIGWTVSTLYPGVVVIPIIGDIIISILLILTIIIYAIEP